MKNRVIIVTSALSAFIILWISQPAAVFGQQEYITPEPLKIDVKVDSVGALLTALLPALIEEEKIPGLAIGLIRDGSLAWAGYYGVADKKTDTPVTKQTVFQAASFTKVVFSYAVLRLVKLKVIELDKPLYRYFEQKPDNNRENKSNIHNDRRNRYFDNNEENYVYDPFGWMPVHLRLDYVDNDDSRMKLITARMVLSHRTGLPNWRINSIRLYLKTNPGTVFGYSGEGFVFLQNVIEHLTGMTADKVVSKYVFNPLKMKNSSLVWQKEYNNTFAGGHDHYGNSVEALEYKKPNAAVSMFTTLEDMGRFIHALLIEGPLPSQEVEEMMSPEGPASGTNSDNIFWGLGCGLEITPEGKTVWQWGNNLVEQAFMMLYPEQKAGVVYFTNSENGLSRLDEILTYSVGGYHPSVNWLEFQKLTPLRAVTEHIVKAPLP